MPITRPHELGLVEIHTAAVSQVVLGVEDLSVPSGTDTAGGALAGTVWSEHESVSAQRPEMSFSCVGCIATALDTVPSPLGLNLAAGANIGLAAYLAKRSLGGTYESGSAHRRYRIRAGVLVPTTLSAGFQDNVRLGYRAVAIYDGTNPPVHEEDLVARPSGAVRNEFFTLFGLSVGGVALPGCTGVEVDFGMDVIRSEGSLSDPSENIWPTHASINRITPTITIGGIDPEWVKDANIPRLGKAATHANTLIELARREHGGTIYAVGATEHIAITTAGLVYADTFISASDKANGTVSLMLRSVFDGTNAPLIVQTGQALTL